MSDSNRIDIRQERDLRDWSKKLDATPEQLKEAVQAVGDSAADVEQHLKGSRATTNAERTREATREDLKEAAKRDDRAR